jgi:hypothetical protein
MRYNPFPPYELLGNKSLPFEEMQQMRRFSRHWDLLVNSGNFLQSAPLLWAKDESPFWSFMRFSDWLYARVGRNHAIALGTLAELLFEYLTAELQLEPNQTANAIYADYERGGRSDKPAALRPYLVDRPRSVGGNPGNLPKRQSRHLAVSND